MVGTRPVAPVHHHVAPSGRQDPRGPGLPARRGRDRAVCEGRRVPAARRRALPRPVRLDGPRTPDGFAPAPAAVDADTLAELVRQSAASVRLTVPGVDVDDPSRMLVFGRQVDVRPVRTSRRTDDPARSLSPEQVAGYLAKYATKSVEDTGATATPHHRRIRATAHRLADRASTAAQGRGEPESPYELLDKWVHMLGFRGHFGSKSRRYSITLRALRRARRRAQALIAESRAEGRPLDLAALEADLLADDDTETTLVFGQWHYLGSGWSTDGQRVLATAAAARAREYDQFKAQLRRQNAATEQGSRSGMRNP